MKLTRRRLMGSSLAALAMAGTRTSQGAEAPLPWRNWSGGQQCVPAGRFAPGTEDELLDFLVRSKGALRPVGAGHSFSGLVPTDGTLLVLDRLSGLRQHDAATYRATFGGGTRIADMGAPLDQVGQGMVNLADIDRQTLAGAIATSTHGTGIDFGSLSTFVTRVKLATVRGEILNVDAAHHPDVFAAVRCNLGALGVVTEVELANRASYRLKERMWTAPVEEVLETFEDSARTHRHFEMFPMVHSDYAIVQAIDETDDALNPEVPDPEADAAFDAMMRGGAKMPVALRAATFDAALKSIPPSENVDVSYRILANVRNGRFNEMEYELPREAGADCLREILRTIRDQEIDIAFPLEYRYVKGDDISLSMFHGRDSASISVHNFWDIDYRPYFAVIEPIFWKYEGRPHWGKVHTLTAERLRTLYPAWQTFLDIRADLDPEGRLLNDHLRTVFGLS